MSTTTGSAPRTLTFASALSPASTSTAGTDPILLYAQDWNQFASSRTASSWQQVAMTHAVLVGSPGPVYGKMISQLHAWNPKLKVLVYDLGPYTIKGTSEYQQLATSHPEYFSHDAAGKLITVKAASGSPPFVNNTLMDEGNSGWQAWEAQRILTNVTAWGFDGGYLDSMGPGVFTGTTTGVPIDPRTGVAYTKISWMMAAGQALTTIKTVIGTKYLFSTGLVNGPDYTSFTHYLSDSKVDGVQTDSWLRLANSPPTQFPSAGLLASDLAMVQSLNAQGKAFYGWTKVWTTATPAQQAAWNIYALAAYLLVDNGVNDYYTYNSPFKSDRTTIFFSNELAALGAATGAFSLVSGIYTRPFQHGLVTLNTITNVATITVS